MGIRNYKYHITFSSETDIKLTHQIVVIKHRGLTTYKISSISFMKPFITFLYYNPAKICPNFNIFDTICKCTILKV